MLKTHTQQQQHTNNSISNNSPPKGFRTFQQNVGTKERATDPLEPAAVVSELVKADELEVVESPLRQLVIEPAAEGSARRGTEREGRGGRGTGRTEREGRRGIGTEWDGN